MNEERAERISFYQISDAKMATYRRIRMKWLLNFLQCFGFQKNLSFAWSALWPPDLLACSGVQKNPSFVWVPLLETEGDVRLN